MQVKNVPKGGHLTEKDVSSILEAAGVKTRSVHFDNNLDLGNKRTALVRLEPPGVGEASSDIVLLSGKLLSCADNGDSCLQLRRSVFVKP